MNTAALGAAGLVMIPALQADMPSGDEFAISIVAGRDLDGDGIPDVVVSDSTSPDRAEVWFVAGVDGSVFAHRTGPAGFWGPFLSWVGDIDRNGIEDIGVSWSEASGSRHIEILCGRDGGVLRTIQSGGDGFEPLLIHPSGDTDADGYADPLVTGTLLSSSGRSAPCVRVLSGRDGSILQEIEAESRASKSCSWAAGIGDVDGDGRDDLAACWSGEFLTNRRIILYSGRTGACLRELPGFGGEPRYGESVDTGMDHDGDGVPDFVAGSPYRFDVPGVVRVQSGRDGSVLRTVEGIHAVSKAGWGGSFGACVRFVRDVDEDSVPELLIGMPRESMTGSAFLCSGRTGAVLFEIQGRLHEPGPGEADLCEHHLGAALADAGDLDGDGAHDLAIAHVPEDRLQVGRVQVVSSRTGRVLLSIDRESMRRANER